MMRTITPTLKVDYPTPNELNKLADLRVVVYCLDGDGQWWRTYVEPTDGKPHVETERVVLIE